MLHIVWFKRDLRWQDHAPLVQAAASGAVLPMWVDEPAQWQQADASARHRAFVLGCVRALAEWISHQGGQLYKPQGDVLDVLATLKSQFGPFALHSHEETGNDWSYARDRAVERWCAANAVQWHQQPSNSVVRRLATRDQWSRQWDSRMRAAPLAAPTGIAWQALHPLGQTADAAVGQAFAGNGPQAAQALLESFLYARGQHYRTEMSSPLTADTACSRISEHLAWGSISIRQCVHALWARRTELLAQPLASRPAGFLQSLKSFEGRLHWHCHFIQKLESEPAIEWRNVNRGFDGVRNEGPLTPAEQDRLQAWASGQTGYPFVDACMRSLNATGWINFRMRALLMSFASYQLWLHWRASGLHLARQFTDYEPGIHWSQCQMQSGVTGINTVRIYNPIKQGLDQDPEGHFVRRWVPEVAHLTSVLIHTPWLASPPPQRYPPPIVDLKLATQAAKEAIYQRKAQPTVKAQAQGVYQKHGSRKPGRQANGGVELQARVPRAKTPARPRASPAAADTSQLSLGF
jgi:deoxyribodipyrimidine photo-lyase